MLVDIKHFLLILMVITLTVTSIPKIEVYAKIAPVQN
jgi:hypothetical protein